MAAYQYPPFSPEGIAMNGSKYTPDSPESLVMNGRPPAAAPVVAPVDTTKSQAALNARSKANPVTVGKQPSPFLDAVGGALSTVLGIGDAQGAELANKSDYSQGAAGPNAKANIGPMPSLAPEFPAMSTPGEPSSASYGQSMAKVLGAPSALVGAALGVPEYTSRATKAAGEAAAKESENHPLPAGNYGMFNRSGETGPLLTDPATPAAPVDKNAEWNDFVGHQLANMGVPNAAGVASQTPPAWDKASGEAAINAGGGPRLLNYGNDNTIVGQATNGSKKLNSFTGFGHEGAGPGGSGGVSADPIMQAYKHVTDLMAQSKALSERGDITGALQARGLRSQAKIMAELFGALSTHGYQHGVLGVQNREAALREHAANPSIKMGELQAAAIGSGNLEGARKIEAAKQGQRLQATPAMGYVTDPITGETRWQGFPTDAFAR